MLHIDPALFYTIATVIILGAIGTVFASNLFHAGISLITSFLGVGALYLAIQQSFFAALQVLVYSGAIAVLLLFAFMLTQNIMNPDEGSSFYVLARHVVLAGLLVASCIYCVRASIFNPSGTQSISEVTDIRSLGVALLQDHIVPFELVSVLLFVGLMGSIYIARKEEDDF